MFHVIYLKDAKYLPKHVACYSNIYLEEKRAV